MFGMIRLLWRVKKMEHPGILNNSLQYKFKMCMLNQLWKERACHRHTWIECVMPSTNDDDP